MKNYMMFKKQDGNNEIFKFVEILNKEQKQIANGLTTVINPTNDTRKIIVVHGIFDSVVVESALKMSKSRIEPTITYEIRDNSDFQDFFKEETDIITHVKNFKTIVNKLYA